MPDYSKPVGNIVTQAEQRLARQLARIGNGDVNYLRCFHTGNARELAPNWLNASLYARSEPVAQRAPAALQLMRWKCFAPEQSRSSTLNANAPRLWKDNAADYWHFHPQGALGAFIDRYQAL